MLNKLLAAALLAFACSTQPSPVPPSPTAVDAALLQVAAWAAAHKAPAEDVFALEHALQQRDYLSALDAAKKALSDAEIAGEYVPVDLQKLVALADDAAHSLATPPDAGR